MTEPTDSERRVKGVPIHDEYVNELFSGSLRVITGLPDDATFRRFYREPERDQFVVVFQSDEFDPVEEGERIPYIDINVVDDHELYRLADQWRKAFMDTETGHKSSEVYQECAAALIDLLEADD